MTLGFFLFEDLYKSRSLVIWPLMGVLLRYLGSLRHQRTGRLVLFGLPRFACLSRAFFLFVF